MALTKVQICNMALSKLGNERLQLTNTTYGSNTGKAKDQLDLHYEQTLKELVRMHTWNCTKERAQLVESVKTITDSNDVEYSYNATENGKAQFSNTADDKRIRYNSTASTWEYGTYSDPNFTKVEDVSSTADLPPLTGWSDSSFTLTFTRDFGWDNEFILPSDCLRPVYLAPTSDSTDFLRPKIEWTIEVDRIFANTGPVYLLYIKQPEPEDMDSLFAQAFYTLLAVKLAQPITGDIQLSRSLYDEFINVVMPEARRVNGFEGQEHVAIDSAWIEATFASGSSFDSSWRSFGSASWETSFPWS